MIVGTSQIFAIESEILHPVDCISQQAVGFFVVHVAGRQFGIRDPQATLLGCSVDAIERRLTMRGSHLNARLSSLTAESLAAAYLACFYGNADDTPVTEDDFLDGGVMWCPDGDAAFDDGSHILQFDLGEQVRLVAFRNETRGAADLADQTISAEEYYSTLRTWLRAFRSDRMSALKNARRN